MPTAIDGIGTTGSTAGPSTTSRAAGSRELGKNEFLKLLVTQLGNQDPLKPTENEAFIAQLAQFSALEAQQVTNSRLEALLIAQAAANQTGVATLVGKDVTYKTNSVILDGGQGVVRGSLERPAASVTARITDEAGRVVRTLQLRDVPSGQFGIAWDGLDEQGQALPSGTYKVELTAVGQDGQGVAVAARATARATGVSFASGVPELIVNGFRVKLADVLEVNQPGSSSAVNVRPPSTTAPTPAAPTDKTVPKQLDRSA